MLYRMDKNKLQMDFQLQHVHAWIELGQVGIGNKTWIHSDPLSQDHHGIRPQVKGLSKVKKIPKIPKKTWIELTPIQIFFLETHR